MAKKKVAININFDSLSECAALVGLNAEDIHRTQDPCYLQVIERFFRILDEYGAVPSIYVIGRDLEQSYIANAVRTWQDRGCEIGNHSWSHQSNLGWLPQPELRQEIEKSHYIIANTTGQAPKGFIAPAWTYSPRTSPILKELGYLYDTSLAPTWLLELSQLQLWLKSPGRRKQIPFVRPDFFHRYLAKSHFRTRKFNNNSIIEAPLPNGLFKTGFWHTLFFLFPTAIVNQLFHSAISRRDHFYYLLHPLDLFDPKEDMQGLPQELLRVTRLNIPIQQKEDLLRKSMDFMAKECEFVTMRSLVLDYAEQETQ